MQTKTCTKCGSLKPLVAFYFEKKRNLYRPECLICTRKRSLDYRNTHRQECNAAARQYYQDHREQGGLRSRAYRRHHPNQIRQSEQQRYLARRSSVKYKAQQQVKDHVYRQTLLKPNTCSSCKKVCEPRELHGHHEDYSKPLDVVWLCRDCHWQVHRKAS